MATYNFSVQKQDIFGTRGEFSVGVENSKIRAKYLLTKIRPGDGGYWENHLATAMKPWRETFPVDELSFDELIQRDLDDGRVAHDLIPYLLGESGHQARFFPPILAVLVPKKENSRGIALRYPGITIDGPKERFGDLFSCDQVPLDGEATPLGVISYNAQRTAMVIVDGQHRAMAVLALHRQLTGTWGDDPFSSYYTHIAVDRESVNNIELPVCIVYFPDIHEGNEELKDKGVNLIKVCREIFTVVNKQAKPVGKSRELLLNDDDFSAIMMRKTLSKIKSRADDVPTECRLYSIAYGDEENASSGQGLAGRIEISSAVAIHKLHSASAFALPAAFTLAGTSDVSDGRQVRNPTRPISLLMGNETTATLRSLNKQSAKTHKPHITSEVVNVIGELTDEIFIPLLDRLRPFAVHNEAARELLEALNDPAIRTDPIQNKCRSLLFDGSGNRSVFEEHADRLKEYKADLVSSGAQVPQHLLTQINYCESVRSALEKHEEELKNARALKLYSIDPVGFSNRDKSEVERDKKVLKGLARTVFDTLSTQAFQLGYVMAVLTAVERITAAGSDFKERLSNTKFISELYLAGLNSIFDAGHTKHKSLSGYVTEDRARLFDSSSSGFRGLLHLGNVKELNERQWEFFRYMVLEVVHSRRAFSAINEVFNKAEWSAIAQRYKTCLPKLLEEMDARRSLYFEAAKRNFVDNNDEFKRKCYEAQVEAKSSGKNDDQVRIILEALVNDRTEEVRKLCQNHLSASLGKFEPIEALLRRFNPLAESGEPGFSPGIGNQ